MKTTSQFYPAVLGASTGRPAVKHGPARRVPLLAMLVGMACAAGVSGCVSLALSYERDGNTVTARSVPGGVRVGASHSDGKSIIGGEIEFPLPSKSGLAK